MTGMTKLRSQGRYYREKRTVCAGEPREPTISPLVPSSAYVRKGVIEQPSALAECLAIVEASPRSSKKEANFYNTFSPS